MYFTENNASTLPMPQSDILTHLDANPSHHGWTMSDCFWLQKILVGSTKYWMAVQNIDWQFKILVGTSKYWDQIPRFEIHVQSRADLLVGSWKRPKKWLPCRLCISVDWLQSDFCKSRNQSCVSCYNLSPWCQPEIVLWQKISADATSSRYSLSSMASQVWFLQFSLSPKIILPSSFVIQS